MILVDTSGLFAALDSDSREHGRARSVLAAENEVLVLSPFVLAELDYMIATRFGRAAALSLLDDVAAGAYSLASFDTVEVAAVTTLLRRYDDLAIGLADASLVVLAERHGTTRVLTLDERHFRVLRTSTGQPFTLLPADAD